MYHVLCRSGHYRTIKTDDVRKAQRIARYMARKTHGSANVWHGDKLISRHWPWEQPDGHLTDAGR